MKVTINTRSILEQIPELVPAFRQLDADIPREIEVEGALTPEAVFEREIREAWPQYWEALTGQEWTLWVALMKEKQIDRKALQVIIGARYCGIDDTNSTYEMSNVVDVHIKNLRNKLYALGNTYHIRTHRGWGYILSEGPSPQALGTERRVPFASREKKIDTEGRVVRPRWRPTTNKLNPIEFGYLKEMKMDEVSKEESAQRLCLSMAEIESPWNCHTFEEYSHKFRPIYKH